MFTHHIRSASELEGMGTYKRQKKGDTSNGRLGVRSLRQDENEEKCAVSAKPNYGQNYPC